MLASNGRVLRLIGAYLRAGVKLKNGTVEVTAEGVPQGGPLSPLLASVNVSRSRRIRNLLDLIRKNRRIERILLETTKGI
jgi:retron-type reverse transcriptase